MLLFIVRLIFAFCIEYFSHPAYFRQKCQSPSTLSISPRFSYPSGSLFLLPPSSSSGFIDRCVLELEPSEHPPWLDYPRSNSSPEFEMHVRSCVPTTPSYNVLFYSILETPTLCDACYFVGQYLYNTLNEIIF